MSIKRTIPETRIIAVALLAVGIMFVLGFMLYKNLSDIAEKVGATTKSKQKNSLQVRQILIQIREADNFARTYYLTRNSENLKAFYLSLPVIEEELNRLDNIKNSKEREDIILDSVALLARKRFSVMRQQINLENDEKITDELNMLSAKIDAAFSRVEERKNIPVVTIKDTLVQKEGFINKLFKRKERRFDTVRSTKEVVEAVTPRVTNKMQGDLKKTIKKVKTSQLEKINEKKQQELLLNSQSKAIMDKLRYFMLELETLERYAEIAKIETARKDVNWIKDISVTTSVLISLLFILLGSLIISYLRKKNMYENVLLDAKQQAEELAKAKETFLADMSHEIKTPLNAIYGFTEQVLDTDLNEEQRQQLQIVKKSADYLTRLVNNILSYSKIQAGKLPMQYSIFDLKKELFEMEILFSQQIKNKNISLLVSIEPDVPDYIQSDLTRLKQILFNLISNAIKFTDEGYVKITCASFLKNEKQSLRIVVSDTGVGISADKLPNLFNEYEQAHTFGPKKYDGTGLGLVITKKLLAQLNGTISLSSEENKGTCVEITFEFNPVDQKNGAVNTNSINTEDYKELAGKKILIVDDENFNLLLLKSILSKQNLIITEATNGEEAVNKVKQEHFDLIVMDIRMPVKNGIEACIEMRRMNITTPILASTAVINDQKIKKCVDAGFSGFIYKPISSRELLNTLHRHILHPDLNFEVIPDNQMKKSNGKLNFDDVNAVANGDENFKKELIDLFKKSVSEGLNNIVLATDEGDWKKAADAAHKMMAPCKHFDANDLYQILKYFETLRDQEPEKIGLKSKLQELKKEVATIEDELKIYL